MKFSGIRTILGLLAIFLVFSMGGRVIADQPLPDHSELGEHSQVLNVPGFMRVVVSNYGASLKHVFMLNPQYKQKQRKPPAGAVQPPKQKLAAGPLDLVSTWDPQLYPLHLELTWDENTQVKPQVTRMLKGKHPAGKDTVTGDFIKVYNQDPVFSLLSKGKDRLTFIWPDPQKDKSSLFLIKEFQLKGHYTVNMRVRLISLTEKKVKIRYKVGLYAWQAPMHQGGTCGSSMFSPHPDVKNGMCFVDGSLEEETFKAKDVKASYPGDAEFAAVGTRYFVIGVAPEGKLNKTQCSLKIYEGGVVISRLHELAPLEAYTKPGGCHPDFLKNATGQSCKQAAAALGVNPYAPQDEVLQAFRAKKAAGKDVQAYAAAMASLTKRLVSSNRFLIYTGPKDIDELKSADHNLRASVNFRLFGIPLGWLCIPMLWLMRFSYRFIPNWGVSILFLTIVVKLITFYWTQKSFVQMKKMQALKPELDRLKKKYKNDKDGMNKAMMDLYKRHKVNPLGGCLPMLIQMPIWFALYRTIYSAVELYQAPLFGWITDLSAYDPYFVLPVLLGLATFLQQKFTPQAGDPGQAKVMLYAMPIMFTAFMLFMPSGLTFYILINSILTVGQQWWIQRSA